MPCVVSVRQRSCGCSQVWQQRNGSMASMVAAPPATTTSLGLLPNSFPSMTAGGEGATVIEAMSFSALCSASLGGAEHGGFYGRGSVSSCRHWPGAASRHLWTLRWPGPLAKYIGEKPKWARPLGIGPLSYDFQQQVSKSDE